MTLVELCCSVFMIIWFALTCLRQVSSRLSDLLSSWDIVGVLPVWKFFAPNPNGLDFHLLHRDQSMDGVIQDWVEYSVPYERDWRSSIWNPDRRLRKSVLDISHHLSTFVSRDAGAATIQVSIPYLLLLNYVSCLPRSSGTAQTTQFSILASSHEGFDSPPQVLFASGFHSL